MAGFVKRVPLKVFAVALIWATSATGSSGIHHEKGEGSFTEVAGVEGPRKTELQLSAEYFGLRAVKLKEFDRRLCSLQLEQAALNARTLGTTVLEAVKLCEPKQGEAWKRADLGEGQFVTAISACVSKGKDANLLHGLELWGGALDAEGKLKPAKKSARAAFPECDKWLPKRSCPAGSVATGIRAHSLDAESGAVGLALRCHNLTF